MLLGSWPTLIRIWVVVHLASAVNRDFSHVVVVLLWDMLWVSYETCCGSRLRHLKALTLKYVFGTNKISACMHIINESPGEKYNVENRLASWLSKPPFQSELAQHVCREVGCRPNYSQGVVLKNIVWNYIMFPKHIHTSYMTQFIGVLLCFYSSYS